MSSTRFRRNVVIFLALALGGAAFDLATKSVVFERVGPPPSNQVLIEGMLELQTSYNKGALWGFGNQWPYSSLIFAVLSILAGLAICYWLFILRGAEDLGLSVALGLIMAGAIGNCYDRLALGHVRDFVYFYIEQPIHFECAIFNFADNMLVIGAVLLALLALRGDPRSAEAPAVELSG